MLSHRSTGPRSTFPKVRASNNAFPRAATRDTAAYAPLMRRGASRLAPGVVHRSPRKLRDLAREHCGAGAEVAACGLRRFGGDETVLNSLLITLEK